ncbi:MAG TPA: protein kinase, partial [Terriglobia bacterium]|nr:protein kinase [Terriglobia bacterium]
SSWSMCAARRSRLACGPGAYRFLKSRGIADEIAEAVEEAHANRFVHRDLKPANIMLMPQGHAKVMDFGLTLSIASPSDQQRPRARSNAHAEVSPEVIMWPYS